MRRRIFAALMTEENESESATTRKSESVRRMLNEWEGCRSVVAGHLGKRGRKGEPVYFIFRQTGITQEQEMYLNGACTLNRSSRRVWHNLTPPMSILRYSQIVGESSPSQFGL